MCEKIYKVEKQIKDQYGNENDFYKKRYKIRLEKTAPLLSEFEEYVEREIKDALPKSALGKALEYARKLLPDMKTLLEDGMLEVDNNGSERAVKPFVIGRKNWLFSNSSRGANASAMLYSIIETAKATNLVVEKYLTYLFDMLCKLDVKSRDEVIEIMPWSATLPEEVRILNSKNK